MSFIKAIGAKPILFYTSATEKMRIDSSGNISFGGISPVMDAAAGGLHIHSSATSTEIKLTNTGTGTTTADGAFLLLGGSGNLFLWNNEASKLSLGTSGGEKMAIDSNGKVTIFNQAIIQGGANIPWTTGKSYSVDDVVLKDGYLIKCVTAHTSGTYSSDVILGYWQMASIMKNFLINGNFDIWQRGQTFTNITNGIYSSDRWKILLSFTGGTCTTQISTNVPNSNSQFCIDVSHQTANATSVSSYALRQFIEKGTIIALMNKPVTLSFYYISNKTGTHAVKITNANQTGATGTINQSFSFTVNAANVWQKVIIQTTLSVTTMGSDAATEGIVLVDVGFAAGTVIGQATLSIGDYFRISQIMLNEGPAPSLFQTAAPNLSGELTLCKRYYTGDIFPTKLHAYSATTVRFQVLFPIQLRIAPTLSQISTPSFGIGFQVFQGSGGAGGPSSATLTLVGSSPSMCIVDNANYSGRSLGEQFHNWAADGARFVVDVDM